MTDISDADLAVAAERFEASEPAEVLRWAADRFASRLAFASSLGVEDVVLIDLASRAGVAVDAFTLDTGLLFPETYQLWQRLEQCYGITIRAIRPELTVDAQATAHGDALWARQPDDCCRMRKVEPLTRAAAGLDAWVTGIRRDQTPERATARVVERDRRFGLIKVSPLVRWTSDDVWRHVHANEVPYNPLHDHGFPSIGCKPCTSPVADGEDPRAGRWRGAAKTECGLHGRSLPQVGSEP